MNTAMRLLFAGSLVLAAFAVLAFELALRALTINDDLSSILWGAVAGFALSASGRLISPIEAR
jgi:hypothetical protein